MADEIYLLTRNYAYDDVSVASTPGTSVGANTPDLAIDRDHDTYWETVDALPQLVIDLGSAITIDSLWFKHSANVVQYRVYHSPDDIVYTAVDVAQAAEADGYTPYFEFTPATRRYWRIDVTSKTAGNTLIYEALLMEHRLTLTGDTSLPAQVHRKPTDRIGGSYPLANGTVTSYAGSKVYQEVSMQFSNTPQANRDNLYGLFSTPTIRPALTIYPEHAEYPGEILQVVWKSIEFGLVYVASYKGEGFSGTLEFSEY